MSVYLCIPSARPNAEECLSQWRAAGYKLAIFREERRGRVDAEGFDGHKTAGLGEGEMLEGLSRDAWLAKGARAQENRVQFPAEGVAK